MVKNLNIKCESLLMENKECAICYEVIGNTNACVTPCGHEFCFKCMIKSFQTNDTCPMCRTTYLEKDELLHSDSEDEDDDETLYGSDDDDDEYNYRQEITPYMTNVTKKIPVATPQIIANKLSENGYTMEDIITLWTARVNRENPRYSQSFINKMDTDIDKLIKEVDEEKENLLQEREIMMKEDNERQKEIDENIVLEGVRLLFNI